MDVGQNRDVVLRFDAGEDAQPFVQPWSAKRGAGRPVGFVVRRFEDERHAEPARNRRQSPGELGRVGLAFDDAGAGDEDERLPAADRDIANCDRVHGDHYRYRGLEGWRGWRAGGRSG